MLKSVTLLDFKHLDIIDVVSSSSIMSQSASDNLISSSEGGGGGQLIFKSGPLKRKLEYATLYQWPMANISTMYKLLETWALNLVNYLHYMSYTKQMYHLL